MSAPIHWVIASLVVHSLFSGLYGYTRNDVMTDPNSLTKLLNDKKVGKEIMAALRKAKEDGLLGDSEDIVNNDGTLSDTYLDKIRKMGTRGHSKIEELTEDEFNALRKKGTFKSETNRNNQESDVTSRNNYHKKQEADVVPEKNDRNRKEADMTSKNNDHNKQETVATSRKKARKTADTTPKKSADSGVVKKQAIYDTMKTRMEQMEGKMQEFRNSISKQSSEMEKGLSNLDLRTNDLESRLDEEVAITLDDIVTRVNKLEQHKEETHRMIKELQPSANKHNHICGKLPKREGTVGTERDGFARYECKPGYVLFGGGRHTSRCEDNGQWSDTVDIVCKDLLHCQTMYKGKRSAYSGTVNTTVSGKTCQAWSKHSPHGHWYFKDSQFKDTNGNALNPDTTKTASNFCRDPGHFHTEKKVWCYTTDPKTRWEVCNVKWC